MHPMNEVELTEKEQVYYDHFVNSLNDALKDLGTVDTINMMFNLLNQIAEQTGWAAMAVPSVHMMHLVIADLRRHAHEQTLQ